MKRFEIASVVKDLGISAGLKGYCYIISAVQLLLVNSKIMYCFMSVYEQVAKEYGVTAVSVERAMRHAIGVGWDRANPETAKKMFGYSLGEETPTTSEFVVTIADYLLMVCEENDRQKAFVQEVLL